MLFDTFSSSLNSKIVASRLSWTEGGDEPRAEVRRHSAEVQTGQHYSLFTWRGGNKERFVSRQRSLVDVNVGLLVEHHGVEERGGEEGEGERGGGGG